jgi:hypothetical protein
MGIASDDDGMYEWYTFFELTMECVKKGGDAAIAMASLMNILW